MMSDPILTAAVGGVVGAFAKKFVEETWDAGKKWLTAYYADNTPKTIAIAEQRAGDFLNRLAEKVERIKEDQALDREVIDRALEDPSFGALLRNALIHSAQTADENKHEILARLVSERLVAEAESTKAMVIPLACTAIGHLVSSQLTVLAIHAAMRFGPPLLTGDESNEEFLEKCNARFETLLRPFEEILFTAHDLEHLEAVGCGQIHRMTMSASEGLPKWKSGSFSLVAKTMFELPFFRGIGHRWARGFFAFSPTSVGQMIGLAAIEASGVADLGPAHFGN